VTDKKEKKYSILVADDSRSAQSLIAGRLVKLGYHVHLASDGKEAYQLFLKEKPDLILMDANMPVVDGYRACGEVKRHPEGANTRVIMVTGQGDDESVDRAFSAGAEEFVTKPIHWAVLEQRIHMVIERNRSQIALKESSARMEAVYNAVADGIFVINDCGIIETLNHSAARIFGYWEWELLEKNISLLMPTEISESHDGYLKRYMETGIKKIIGNRFEVMGQHKKGHHFPLEISVTEVKLEKRVVFTGVVRDITKRKEAEEKIYHQANYDALTDLPNRSLFMKNLDSRLGEAKENGTSLALIFIDLDRFKWINDNLGHPAGDALLQAASQRIKELVDEKNAVARLGGDEFTATVTGFDDLAQMEKLSFDILTALNRAFELEGQEVYISGSLGVALYPQDAQDLETLLKQSDEAMYLSKNAGRNAYHFCGGQSKKLEKKY
jgi:diguanylate cyclase (GGDEF)-like protein/PAS domain S-box-containing protein